MLAFLLTRFCSPSSALPLKPTRFLSPFFICSFIFVFVVVLLSFYVVGFVLPVFMED